jgi:hypothetical protein
MMGRSTPAGPEDEFSSLIKSLQQQINDIRNAPFRIPVLPEDPPTTDPTNMWMLPDGRIRARHRNPTDTAWVIREWVTTSPGSSTSGATPAPPTVAPTSRQGIWTATWSASYRSAGPKRTDHPDRIYWGSSGDSFNGRNRSYIGFDATTIAAALSGGTVTRVRLRLQALHTYWNNGAGIGFGYHGQTSAPGSWAGTLASLVSQQRIGKTQLKEFDLPLVFGTAIRDGSSKGIAVEAPNSSTDYYGYAGGVGSGVTPPTLIIDYAK